MIIRALVRLAKGFGNMDETYPRIYVRGVSYDSPDARLFLEWTNVKGRGGGGGGGEEAKIGTIESNDRKGSGRYLDRKDILERCSWLSANRAR